MAIRIVTLVVTLAIVSLPSAAFTLEEGDSAIDSLLSRKSSSGMAHPLKWGSPALGTGAVITYSFVTSGEIRFLETGRAYNKTCPRVEPIDSLLDATSFSFKQLKEATARGVAQWAAVADILFVPVADQRQADVLIGKYEAEVGNGFANIRFNDLKSGDDAYGSIKGVVCLNANKKWTFDWGSEFNLEVTITHEFGHILGLAHSGDKDALMHASPSGHPTLNETDSFLAQYLYGPRK